MEDYNIDKCPYCGEELCIEYDDYDFVEDEFHEEECIHCGGFFKFTRITSYSYHTYKAPCLNGDDDHKFEQIIGVPKELFVGRVRCKWCGREEIDIVANKKSRAEYIKKLED
ncbi:MAG: hypothetical protein ACTSYW_00620 [Candidatus Heimdallarchaeota archaeon]